ncbi:serine O-acetyltransferase EpsC [Actinacidiphila sp. ITFR-21]|uniref:serine O-acetyltransferase EpsC n=1 Tax=Actinacidiphila sp. ITFR-21 TaxID=3075199 RepID=UPI00288BE4C4|nr:serine O-acetyltransferase EpsC [Streptomyces sp. ITFR-21]WNI18845.1 serine O-acetyltransferase EpsC [Streptomyces sp. ITFR-21]
MRRTIARAKEDLAMIVARDPSIGNRAEALLHPALPALWTHRLAHGLHTRGHRRIARLLAYLARAATGGIEIHPGASLGRRVFIDHGAAVVIGETAEIGDDVTIFHQVTLGAVGWWRDNRREPAARRHPRVGDRVVIGTNAIVLGPVTVGDDALVGAGSLVVTDVPAGARVLAPVAEIVPRPAPEDRVEPAPSLRALATFGCW